VGHYDKDHYGTKGYHPNGVPRYSGPVRAQLKSQHNTTRVLRTVAHQQFEDAYFAERISDLPVQVRKRISCEDSVGSNTSGFRIHNLGFK
jgi:hypothetical protein